MDEHDVYDHRGKIPSASSSVLAAATLPSSSSSGAAAATAASVTDLLNGRGSSSAATTASPPLSEDNDASSLMGGGGGSGSHSQSQHQPPLDLPPDLPPPPPPDEPPPPPDQPPPGSVVDHYSDLTVRVGSLDDGTSTHDGSSVNLQQPHHHHHHAPLHHLHHLHDHHHHHHHDSNGGLGLTPEDAAAMEQLHQSMLAEQQQQQQFQYLQHLHDSNVNDLSALMVGGGGNGVGMGCANSGASSHMRHPMNETSLMLMGSSSDADHVKLPTAKERSNYLIRYARKFGLNDRGCYLSCGLAALAFVLFVAIIVIVANWPGKTLCNAGVTRANFSCKFCLQ